MKRSSVYILLLCSANSGTSCSAFTLNYHSNQRPFLVQIPHFSSQSGDISYSEIPSPQRHTGRIHRNNNHKSVHQRRLGRRVGKSSKTSPTNAASSNSLEPARREWLYQATNQLLQSATGTLQQKGKWHEAVSLLTAWCTSYPKFDAEAPVLAEALLKRLVKEKQYIAAAAAYINATENSRNTNRNSEKVVLHVGLYNQVLDAWACAALFQTTPYGAAAASQRAREILVLLQETYEKSKDARIQPNEVSFDLVLHVVCRVEGPVVARRLLAWMEHLYKTGKNPYAQPDMSDYITILDTYANSRDKNAGLLAEGFLRHLINTSSGVAPNTFCYNIAIKAWNKANISGRESAEHADRILEEMLCEPDLVTYASVISAWAQSGMKAHAVARVEELLRRIEAHPTMEPNTIVLNSVMSAWVKSRNPAAVERTAEILRQMEMCETTPPDLISYNTHIHALSMHAKRPGMAERAKSVLEKMESAHDQGQRSFGPNLFTYNLVIEAFCRAPERNNAMLAADILRKLIKREGVEPDAFSFNQVLSALSRSGMKRASSIALELLQYMDDAYRSGVHPNARPDAVSYSSVMTALSRSGERGAAERAEQLMREIQARSAEGETYLQPNRVCYNALIDCWARSGQGTFGARKAESILKEMQDKFDAGDESVAPDIVTFNAVLNAWALSGTRCCGHKAESYLDKMWDLYKAGDIEVKPNDLSYNTVIKAISKSKNERKAQKALRILRRMDKLYQAGNKEARPNEVTYTAVLNSCAFPAALDERTRRKALDTAIFTLKELQSSRYGQPNQVTYGTFIKACANLLPDNVDLRREIIREAFQQCCKDGQVGEMVLTYLKRAAPADLYDELLQNIIRRGAVVSVDDLPPEWKCNVRDQQQWKSKQNTRPPFTTRTSVASLTKPRRQEQSRS